MRGWICGFVILALCGGACFAQEQPTPDQYKKMYTDSLNQLKAAQDRKNELSAANEKLKKENAALQQQTAGLQKQLAALQEEKAHFSDKTFFLRSYYAAWRQFIGLYPRIGARWDDYISNDVPPLPPPRSKILSDNWPLAAE
jgi:Skp family chaperone for outer membrane proteins